MKREPKRLQQFFDSFADEESPDWTPDRKGDNAENAENIIYVESSNPKQGRRDPVIIDAATLAEQDENAVYHRDGSDVSGDGAVAENAAAGEAAGSDLTPAGSSSDSGLRNAGADSGSGLKNAGADSGSDPGQTGSNSGSRTIKTSRRKKRSVVNNRLSLRMAVIFFAFMLLLAILLVVLPRPATSEIERRSLATVPQLTAASWFSGDYTSGVTLAYDDTVPARDNIKNISNNIKSAFGISTANTVEVIGAISRTADNSSSNPSGTDPASADPSLADPSSANTSAANTSATDPSAADPSLSNSALSGPGQTGAQNQTENGIQFTPASDQKETSPSDVHSKNYHQEVVETVNEDGIIVAFQDGHWRAMSLIQFTYNSLYNDVVNYIRQVLDKNVNVYFMPIPISVEFYCPPDYVEYTTELEDVYKEVSSKMISGIKCIDLIPALNDHNEEDIYLRTDHHWAQLGAYYAAKCFAENANVPFAELDTYTRYVNEGYVGTMYAFTESANILNDPEDFVYYVPGNSYTADYYDPYFQYIWTGGLFYDMDLANSYSTFMDGDDHIVKITTDVGNGRRLLVVKDSYGNAMVPCLTNSFEEIYVIDERYFEVNLINFIEYNHITDVLFCNNYFCLTGPFAELLEFITYSNYDVVISDDAPKPVLPDRSGKNQTEEDAAGADDAAAGANDEDAEGANGDDAAEEAAGAADGTWGDAADDMQEADVYDDDYYEEYYDAYDDDNSYDVDYDTYDDDDSYDTDYNYDTYDEDPYNEDYNTYDEESYEEDYDDYEGEW